MKILGRVALVLLAAVSSYAQAAKIDENHQRNVVLHILANVEKAFNKKMATLAEQGLPVDARSVDDLFPGYGFAPTTNQNVTWRIYGVDERYARVCITVKVQDAQQWGSLILAMPSKKLSFADNNCAPLAEGKLIPEQYPTEMTLIKILDSEKVVKPSWMAKAEDVESVGASNEAQVCPSVLLERTATLPSPWYRLEIRYAPDPDERNPSSKNNKKRLDLTELNISAGFDVTHDCKKVKPGDQCSIWVRYSGGPVETLGTLEFALSNGHAQKLTLLGRQAGQPKTGISANCNPLMCSTATNGSSDPACYFGVKQKRKSSRR